ncbi:MAG: uracil-DNA glycosylase [Treponema sp.]|nr:uracil-DNA glycosylase [Treponema sp.]
MNKEDKQQIFNLLKTCDAYIYGYTRDSFINTPDFDNFQGNDVFSNEITKNKELKNPSLQYSQTIQTIQSAPSTLSAQSSLASLNGQVSQVKSSTTPQNTIPTTLSNTATSSDIATDVPNQNHSHTLSEINAKIARCTRCGLARTRNNVVPGQGVENPLVMVIGEAPGYDEDMKGQPFVGRAGMLLDKMLAAIQLDRNTNCYIANIIKCRPPQNRDPFLDEQASCFSFLEAQIHLLKPKYILCMGRISSHKLLNTESSVGNLRGKFFDYNGIPLLVTYHPSALLRNEDLKRPAWEDLKLLRKRIDDDKK